MYHINTSVSTYIYRYDFTTSVKQRILTVDLYHKLTHKE